MHPFPNSRNMETCYKILLRKKSNQLLFKSRIKAKINFQMDLKENEKCVKWATVVDVNSIYRKMTER